MIVLDANVLVAFLDATDGHHDDAVSLFEHRFLDGFSASVLTIAEALVHPTRAGRRDAALSALATLGVETLAIDASQAAELARVGSEYHLRMTDAVALHAALSTRSELASFNEELLAAAESAGVTVAR